MDAMYLSSDDYFNEAIGGDSVLGLGDISVDVDIIEDACAMGSIVDKLPSLLSLSTMGHPKFAHALYVSCTQAHITSTRCTSTDMCMYIWGACAHFLTTCQQIVLTSQSRSSLAPPPLTQRERVWST